MPPKRRAVVRPTPKGAANVRRQSEKTEGEEDEPALFCEPKELPKREKLHHTIWNGTPLEPIIVFTALVMIYLAAFSIRLYSVIRYESIIHEYDPQFNYLSTANLVDNGVTEFMNWFDTRAWYPLGRWVGHTVYPGLMGAAAVMHAVLHFFNFTVHIKSICVFLAPFFAGNTSIVTYLLAKECFDTGAALFAAVFIAIAPGYCSRSVAGSYDNEAVAIFAMVTTFYCFVKAVRTGSICWAGFASLAYGYMIAAWGGYVYIGNLIPAYVYGMILLGRYSHRLYIAYSIFHVLGSLFAMQLPFVGFSALAGSTHALGHIVFFILQLYSLSLCVKDHVHGSKEMMTQFAQIVLIILISLVLCAEGFGSAEGRLSHLLNPSGSKLAIISSVSEHHATSWSSYWQDLGFLIFLVPLGVWYCVAEWSDSSLFLLAYYVTSMYFSSVMIRLVLILTPSICIIAGVAASRTAHFFVRYLCGREDSHAAGAWAFLCGTFVILMMFLSHSTWVTRELYSSPSLVLRSSTPTGQVFYDDYREAYTWLRMNTPEDAKIASWWDYGYQTSHLANRSTIVDNNTWNNTHIATVGKCMASSEDSCYEILRRLDVSYIFVVFGGVISYSSDDIGKFMWMVKIASGVYPEIQEDHYVTDGRPHIGSSATPSFLNSMMYKMAYYRFNEMQTLDSRTGNLTAPGYDPIRRTVVSSDSINFNRFEEAFTTEHWMVRIYKVKNEDNS
eukprot:TRINITY_DN1488_c1_g1_i1.p1 TRINITY_DN1488_c1_g1~~TRINITY_DN1488_c1_g1_i1.p1  ORF type:complete len:740 (+),score=115.06 TRINITY_DN1488_c1_g1_i1:45-2222(+)